VALTATMFHIEVELSDVDRGVYDKLELHLARHPSETMRFMITRALAYCLSYEDGIAFSKGGLSAAEEAPITIRDATGILLAWIDIGSPSAERLHKASKAARRVAIFSAADLMLLRREVAKKPIHKVEEIEVYAFEPSFVDAIEAKIEKRTKMDLLRTEGQLYVTIGGSTIEGSVRRSSLVE
jgi:uncharacterized protein YaeQ